MFTVFLLSCLAYHSVLDFFFTGTDTLTLVETSRVHSLHDLLRLLSEPLMGGTRFVDVAKFYRPLAALSYSFDYAVWGLNPWGFQLTNLLVNALAATLAVLVFFELSGKDVSLAWLGGIIFAIHPILVESVPATDRRQDMLAAVFLLMSLVLFLRHRRLPLPKKSLIFFSVAAYVLALASKEIAIILPVLVCAHVFLFTHGHGLRNRFLSACAGGAPYLAATVIYLLWRTKVLRGIGGYQGTQPLPYGETMRYAVNVLYNYATDLMYPVDLFGIRETSLAGWWTWLILALFGGYVGVCVRRGNRWNATRDHARDKAMVLYLLVWLALPLLVFVMTLTFSHRSMYIPAIPFSALVAYPLVQSCRSLMCLFTARPSRWAAVRSYRVMVAATGAVFVLYVMAYSPLVRKYGQWQDSARIASLVLTQLASEARSISQDYRIEVYDLPDRIRCYESKIPAAKEVTYLRDYSIESWLHLLYPGRSGKVVVRSRSWPWEFSGTLRLGLVRLSQRSLVAFVKIGPNGKPTSVVRR